MKTKNTKLAKIRLLVYLRQEFFSFNDVLYTEVVRIVMHDAKNKKLNCFNFGIIMN